MSNRLAKIHDTVYEPGRPAQPPSPERCHQQRRRNTHDQEEDTNYPRPTSGGVRQQSDSLEAGRPIDSPVMDFIPVEIPDDFSGVLLQEDSRLTQDHRTRQQDLYDTVCEPGSPGHPGEESRFEAETALGWDAGARSTQALRGDGVTGYTTDPVPAGILGGLTRSVDSPRYMDVEFGFRHVMGEPISIIRRGEVVATSPYTSGQVQSVTLSRAAGRMVFRVGDWTYSLPNDDRAMFLAMLIYASGDGVQDPFFGDVHAARDVEPKLGVDIQGTLDQQVHARLGAKIPRAWAALNDHTNVWALAIASGAPLITSTGIVMERGATAEIQLGVTTTYQLPGNGLDQGLGALEMIAADYEYTFGDSALPALEMEALGGAEVPDISWASLSMTPLMMNASVPTGEIVEAELEMGALRGLAADYDYIEGDMTLPALWLYADDWPAIANYYGFVENLWLVAPMLPEPVIIANIESSLEYGTELVLQVLKGDLYLDTLVLDTELSLQQVLDLLIESRLLLASSAIRDPRAQIQYAINTLTGAMTRYSNFDFHSLLHVQGRTYGVKPDGLYELRGGDDDGIPLEALVDLGMKDFGSSELKRLDDVYFGLDTDGAVYLRVGDDRRGWTIYEVEQRDPTSRARTGRGLVARRWAIQLHAVDATQLELDNIEFFLAFSPRRSR